MNDKLNIQDFVNILSEKHHMDKKDADVFVREFFLLIEQALESDKYVKIKGLGTFKLMEVGSRESVNVNTGERFKIEGHTKISFTPDPDLRDLINKPFAHFETVILNENTVLEGTSSEDIDDESGELENKIEISEPEEIQTVNESPVENGEAASEEVVIPEEISKEKETEEPEINIVRVESQPMEIPTANSAKPELSTEEIILRELQETEEKPLVSEPEKSMTPKDNTKDKAPITYLVAIIVVVLLVCGGALAYVYYPDLFSFTNAPQEQIKIELIERNAEVHNVVVDTIAKFQKDTVAEAVPVKRQEVAVPTKEQGNVANGSVSATSASKATLPVNPDSVSYIIVGTKTLYTIKEGETLTRVSLRFYGTKDLWPYIVKHNQDIIKNPDNVPYGTTLKIPELTKK